MVDSSRCNTTSVCLEQVGETLNSEERFISRLLKSVPFHDLDLSHGSHWRNVCSPLTHLHRVPQRVLDSTGLSHRISNGHKRLIRNRLRQ